MKGWPHNNARKGDIASLPSQWRLKRELEIYLARVQSEDFLCETVTISFSPPKILVK